MHQSDIHSEGFRSLRNQEPVEFGLEPIGEGRFKAVNVRPLPNVLCQVLVTPFPANGESIWQREDRGKPHFFQAFFSPGELQKSKTVFPYDIRFFPTRPSGPFKSAAQSLFITFSRTPWLTKKKKNVFLLCSYRSPVLMAHSCRVRFLGTRARPVRRSWRAARASRG